MRSKASLERVYQRTIKSKLESKFEGCVVLFLNPLKILGLPDVLVLYKNRWVALETKRFLGAKVQPLQVYWIRRLNAMSFASFIYPENESEVMDAIQRSFKI